MATHYSKDGKNAYDILRLHPECPFKIPTGARSMTSATIDFEGAQDRIIDWYETNVKAPKNRIKFKTWHIEVIVIGIILIAVTWIFANNPVNWVTTLAILLTFQHAQIGDRLQERQGAMNVKTVECYHKLNKLFAGKELLWTIAFVMMENYAAIVGSVLFFFYPIWRKYYRKHIKPLKK